MTLIRTVERKNILDRHVAPQVKTFAVGPFQSNCAILTCSATGETALIDPGDEPQTILENLSEKTRKLKYILLTHAHIDHILGLGELTKALKNANSTFQICLHKADHPLYLAAEEQGQIFGISASKPPTVDHFVSDNETIALGDLSIRVIWTPGHSPGSVCYFVEPPSLDSRTIAHSLLFSGDTLFCQGIGRTDLWGGSYEALRDSIAKKLFTLPEETTVICGHGPNTTIISEKRGNPFVGGQD